MLVFGIHPGDPPKLIGDFVSQTGITFPILTDSGTLGQLDFAPGVSYPYPRDVVVDKNGVVRSIKNSFDVTEMVGLIEELLAQ
ncbi:MAG: peroxiredoxin [Myxococcota bacterium]